MQPGRRAAVALVFGSSAAVLVVEIVALRLLAPYLGLTLETSTLVIAIALGAIAFGSWQGGVVADQGRPERWLAPIFAVSGLVVALTPVLVRGAGEVSPGLVLLVAGCAILVPGALLSAVTPIVTKLQLSSLDETGAVVGRLSGISTVGSIVGTVITGFVLISVIPVSWILIGLGSLLVLVSLLLGPVLRSLGGAVGAVAVIGLAGLAAEVGPGRCDVETRYHCAVVEQDPDRASGRTLVLDDLRHSYVDLEDPTFLEFEYVKAMAAVVDTWWPAGETIDAHHVGGGGLTLPRYLEATRPGTRNVVSEIDPGVIRIDRDQLDADIPVRVEDGRLGLAALEPDSLDLVVGDAFGGMSVPWHLTTAEAVGQVRRALRDDGVYVLNVIDYRTLRFARAEVATLQATFDHVAVAGDDDGGNLVLVASDRPIDVEAIAADFGARDLPWEFQRDVTAWVDGADVLTDDRAPIDQLISR